MSSSRGMMDVAELGPESRVESMRIFEEGTWRCSRGFGGGRLDWIEVKWRRGGGIERNRLGRALRWGRMGLCLISLSELRRFWPLLR